jgi:hypothetical protein
VASMGRKSPFTRRKTRKPCRPNYQNDWRVILLAIVVVVFVGGLAFLIKTFW